MNFNWKLASAVSVFPSLVVAAKRLVIDGATLKQMAVSAVEVFATCMVLMVIYNIILGRRGEKQPSKED